MAGREYSAQTGASLAVHETPKRAAGAALGMAVYRVFLSAGGVAPPYGTLTGVRPVKMACFYLALGRSADETQEILEREYAVDPQKASLLCRLAKAEGAVGAALTEKDALLYVSVPFCKSRCRYCSFVSHAAPAQLSLLPRYVEQLHEELSRTAELFYKAEKRLRAVYLGGGTPGLLSAADLDGLFAQIRTDFPACAEVEYTAELGRPDSITEEKLLTLAQNGIQRVCVNPQTLSDHVLQANARAHSVEDFYRAFAAARTARIPIVNTDLIAGLHTDTPAGFLNSCREILKLAPENLTLHALCKKRASGEDAIHPAQSTAHFGTALQKAHTLCINAGLQPYYLYRQKNTVDNLENVGYAVEGTECLYNIATMEDLCDVFGVGAGSMTKLRCRTADGDERMVRLPAYKYPTEYLARTEKSAENRKRAAQILQENTP